MEILKCFGLAPLSAYLFSIGLFFLAYLFYRILLSFFHRVFRKKGIGKELTLALRRPILALFLEMAAMSTLSILRFNDPLESLVERILLILVIATMGWLAASLTRALYIHFMNRYDGTRDIAAGERAHVTQMLFLYRFLMFLIFFFTLASILMTFPQIKNVGIGILGSAGVAGIALGIAARPILLNLMAGVQIALTKTIKIGDAVFVENDFSRIEAIHLTHVVARTWDLRRFILPISYFIDRPFQNWDVKDPELITTVFIYCDYAAPIETIRQKIGKIIQGQTLWNKKMWKLQVTKATDKVIELRIMMTAYDASAASDLQHSVREQVIEYLQKEHPDALPCVRNKPVI